MGPSALRDCRPQVVDKAKLLTVLESNNRDLTDRLEEQRRALARVGRQSEEQVRTCVVKLDAYSRW